MLMVNDMPNIQPCDQALKNRLRCIPHTKSFVDKPQAECNEYEMEADPLLKDKVSSQEWIDAFFWILMDSLNNPVKPPQEVLDERDELIVVEDVKLKAILCQKYEFTPKENEDFVSFKELYSYLVEENIHMSETKMGRELKKLGLLKVDKKVNKKTTSGFYGLKE
jgi:hypothetical protein